MGLDEFYVRTPGCFVFRIASLIIPFLIIVIYFLVLVLLLFYFFLVCVLGVWV